MKVSKIKALGAGEKGLSIWRDKVENEYIFVHFLTPVTAKLKGVKTEIKSGGCVIFGEGCEQFFSADDAALLHDWFHVDSECKVFMVKYGLECEKVYYPKNSERITKLVDRIEKEYERTEMFYEDVATSYIEQLLVLLARSSNDNSLPGFEERQREQFVKARMQIHADIRRNWSVEEMAELVNMSPSRFFNVYNKYFGISPKKDLLRSRAQVARSLLYKNGRSLEEVAEIAGYTSVDHFIKQFKNVMGITPGKLKTLTQEEKRDNSIKIEYEGWLNAVPYGMDRVFLPKEKKK